MIFLCWHILSHLFFVVVAADMLPCADACGDDDDVAVDCMSGSALQPNMTAMVTCLESSPNDTGQLPNFFIFSN